ncbi:MAG: DUF3540 domain-containing protein [Wenzhouxiangella sp.]|nr:MAG: DUF3540 domain-containing protein [Wenzhouxiangella sp.]
MTSRASQAAIPIRTEPMQLVARVVDGNGQRWMLATDQQGLLAAQRAASCLLEPRAGDRVLTLCQGDEAWVLAVLERTSGGANALTLNGDISLHAVGGSLKIRGDEDVDLNAAGNVTVTGSRLQLRARVSEFVAEKACWAIENLQLRYGRMAMVGQALDMVARQLNQFAETSVRKVEGMDHKRAGQIDHKARSSMTMQAENVIVQAREVAKVDGDQIQLG